MGAGEGGDRGSPQLELGLGLPSSCRAGENERGCQPRIFRVSTSLRSGPTVLEMFNTLLRQLRLSIDYALTGSYDGAISLGTKIIKEHEERMFQEAVIKTIGTRGAGQGAGPGPGTAPGGGGAGGGVEEPGGGVPPLQRRQSRRCRIATHSDRVLRGHWGKWSPTTVHTALRVAWASLSEVAEPSPWVSQAGVQISGQERCHLPAPQFPLRAA